MMSQTLCKASLAVLLTLFGACGRTPLARWKSDGGTPQTQDASPSGIPDTAPASAHDTAPVSALDARPPGAPDSRAASGPDTASGSAPDTKPADSPDAAAKQDSSSPACGSPPPPLACLRGPSVATELLDFGNGWNVHRLMPAGEEIFAASNALGDSKQPHRISRISLRTHEEEERLHLSGWPYEILYTASSLIYGPASPDPSDVLGYAIPNVLRWDLQTGDRTELPQPSGVQNPNIRALTANPQGEIFWSLKDGSRNVIAKWGPCTRRTELVVEGRDVVFLFADEKAIYWQEPRGGRGTAFAGRTFLYSMPSVAGGAVSLLVDIPTPSWNAPILFAIDDQRLYYLEPGVGLLSMPKQGGERKLLIPNADPLLLSSSTIDDRHVYWVDYTDQHTISRVPKQGGPIELVWNTNGHAIQAIAVDACNLYWFAPTPWSIFYRAK